MIDIRGYIAAENTRGLQSCELREFSNLVFARFNFPLSEGNGIFTRYMTDYEIIDFPSKNVSRKT